MLEDCLSCDWLCQHLLPKSQATQRDLQAIHFCQVLEHLSKLKNVWSCCVASIVQRVFSPRGQSQITHLWISSHLKAAQRPNCPKAADQCRLPASSINDWQNLSSKKEAEQKKQVTCCPDLLAVSRSIANGTCLSQRTFGQRTSPWHRDARCR